LNSVFSLASAIKVSGIVDIGGSKLGGMTSRGLFKVSVRATLSM
jgi:hypothetical protein